jgi:predicted 3-demethylubiquinone-9 3-methyltransferase (glyoxalase superfamily)
MAAMKIQKITPCLWFDRQAEEAATFYVSLFKNSKIKAITHYGEEAAKMSGLAVGTVLTVTFQLNGQEFMGLNGGPLFKFSEAVSFIVNCDSQKEVDTLWRKLTEGGAESQCGWLKDKFGLSWQIVPTALGKMLQDKDAQRTGRVMRALLSMKKIDLKTLERAYRGKR